ncbi:3-hydroxyacyl-CoA dehydrogenase family protein [Roseovarius atlanticus]|uniref:3-hydroxyacyl-CoA dehydrogenase family protein n=1 Tax=Roseovarius atlanticus TaxID=1641875 RepID=UPI000B05E6A5|nr:3-hydroxyacyl-CoA dehydrogenase family protein [Roseovarius atlanticus]
MALLQGSSPTQIDQAMRDFGMAMGPFEAQDMSGLDIANASRHRDGQDQVLRTVADILVEDHNRLGRKTGAGWYDYTGGQACNSSLVAQLAAEVAQKAGIVRRNLTNPELAEVLVEAMAGEGKKILNEGITQKPEDIDLVMIHGYAFPRWRGGLMFHHTGKTAGAK